MAILTSDTSYELLRTDSIPQFGLPFFAALPLCVLLAGIVAIVVGVVFNRFRDDIYVLVSFGFAIIAFNVFLSWRALTRGAYGIPDVQRPQIGGWVADGEMEYLVVCAVFLLIVVGISWFLVSSSFGRVLKAIREDEQVAQVFGYQTTYYKLAIWVIFSDDGRARRRTIRQLHFFRRSQLVHPVGVDASRVDRHPWRSGIYPRIVARSVGVCAARRGDAIHPLSAVRIHRAGTASRSRRLARAADAFQAARFGG